MKCVTPYVETSSGSCVNVMTDINNCGKPKNVCPSNYTSCSLGLCSTVPTLLLINETSLWSASVNGEIDDDFFTILKFTIQHYFV